MAGKKNPAPTKSPGKAGAGKSTSSISSRTASSRNQKPGSQRSATQTIEKVESPEELKRQQSLLNIFSSTFRDVLDAEDFSSQLQEVKAALFNRDFEGAFARETALDVYAARWSPTRALCYGQVLRRLDSHLGGLVSASSASGDSSYHNPGDDSTTKGRDKNETENFPTRGNQDESVTKDEIRDTEPTDPEEPKASTTTVKRGDSEREEKTQLLKVLAIGGAAAEIVAFANYISSYDASTTSTRAEITLLDIGPWGSIVERLQTALTSTPPISRYASTAAREANKPLVPSASLQSSFVQKDILSLNEAELAELIAGPNPKQPILITLLFTLNELYTARGLKDTTSFLRLLSTLAAPGTLLLVIDSPGSYAEAAVGKDAKRYPMQWLLDHTLVPPPSNPRRQAERNEDDGQQDGAQKGGARWEKIESHDSVWFRVAEGLRYPIPLENMRYQMHLYRASGS
ncbi:hypothetical protein F5Y12DRAFT_542213 [Xylaria sp. FL1777]|nr:hypothetical protein F5Y12DRAFT_542213 [Xylaria sp. FL1777]